MLFWNSQTHSVNNSIYDFDWVFQEIPVKNRIEGMLFVDMPYWWQQGYACSFIYYTIELNWVQENRWMWMLNWIKYTVRISRLLADGEKFSMELFLHFSSTFQGLRSGSPVEAHIARSPITVMSQPLANRKLYLYHKHIHCGERLVSFWHHVDSTAVSSKFIHLRLKIVHHKIMHGVFYTTLFLIADHSSFYD